MMGWLNYIRLKTLIITAFGLQAIVAVILTEGVTIWNVSQASNWLAVRLSSGFPTLQDSKRLTPKLREKGTP